MKRLSWLICLLLAVGVFSPGASHARPEVDEDVEGLLQDFFNTVVESSQEMADGLMPYVLNLFLTLAFFDIVFLLYKTGFSERYFEAAIYRLLVHAIMYHVILFSVTPNALPGVAGAEGWGYAFIDWAHSVGREITIGEASSGLSPSGWLKIFGDFMVELAKKYAIVSFFGGLLAFMFGPLVLICFWATVLTFVVLTLWVMFVTLDAVLTAYLGFISLGFLGFEVTRPLADNYLSALLKRFLQIIVAYVMLGIALRLVRDLLLPFIETMNAFNPFAWMGLALVSLLFGFFAVWRLPQVVGSTFSNMNTRLESLYTL